MHNHLRQHLQLPHGNPDSEASSAGGRGSGSGSLPPPPPPPPPPSLLRCFYCPLVAAAGDSGSAALVVAHVLEVHRDKFAHVCEVCEQRFASREPLLVHVGQAHLAAGATVVAVKSLSPDSPVVAGPPVSSVSSSSSSSPTPSFVRASFKSEPAEEVDDIKNRSTPLPPPTAPPPTPLPAKSVRAFPELLAVNSDIFRSFPPEAQRRIQLIVKQGRRAVLTINDNKGGVQKISFGKSQTLSTSTTATTATATAAAAESVSTTIFRRPTSPPVSSSPPDFSSGGGGGGEEEVGVREGCFLRAVKEEEERVAVRDFAVPVWEETPRSAVRLVLDVNFAAGEVDATAAAADTPGVVVEREVMTETSGVAEEMEAATPGTFGIAAGTEIAAGPSSVASVKLEVDSGDLGVKTEPEDHNTGGASASSVAAETEVITGMLSVATEMEVVTGAPEGEIAGTVDLSELATTVTVQTSDAETLALSADDFLKLMKDSHSADEGRK